MRPRSLLAAALSLLAALPLQAASVVPIHLVVPMLGVTGAPVLSAPGAFSSSLARPMPSLGSAPRLQQVPLLAPSLIVAAAPVLASEVTAASSLLAAPLPQGGVSPIAAVANLQNLSAGLSQLGPASHAAVFDLSQRFFDQSGNRGPPSVDVSPKLPPGVKSVTVDRIRTEADIERVVPSGANSDELKRMLKRDVDKMAPYSIYTYHDAFGGTFTGIDLSATPRLVNMIPELQSHEVRLIQKLQGWNKDLQVLIREDGKTPDLVVGGQVMELKSLIGHSVELEFLVNKANKQVFEHGQRHGLGPGALAVDLAEEDDVAVDYVSEVLNKWQAKTPSVVLDQVLVFAGKGSSQRVMFRRGQDGRFSAEALGPDFSGGTARLIKPSDIRKLNLLARKGKLAGKPVYRMAVNLVPR